jgi:uncharacterized protein (DUF1330 family)
MPAYVIVNAEIHEPVEYEVYKQMVPSTIEAYGGRYLVRGGPVDILEGRWTPRRVVVLEFPNKRRALDWWNSSEYADAKAKRQACAYTELIVVEGALG